MSKVIVSQLRVEKLHKDHGLQGFQCYESELVKFLHEDALEHQNKKLSVTYLWFLEGNNQLVGYITLLNDKIDLVGNLKAYFNQKGISFKSIPALKIGKLAVDNKFLRRGIGTLMVAFASDHAKLISEKFSGCRFLTLEAKRNVDVNKDSIHFYKKLNFNILKERKPETPMYLDLLQR